MMQYKDAEEQETSAMQPTSVPDEKPKKKGCYLFFCSDSNNRFKMKLTEINQTIIS